MDVPAATVAAETVEQIRALQEAGGRVEYVKPHGALYHRASVDEGVRRRDRFGGRGLPVLAAPGSALLAQARAAGVEAVTEGFIDRAYAPDGSLVPRGAGCRLGADDAVRQALTSPENGSTCVRSACTATRRGRLELARRVVSELEAAGVELRSFA